MTPTTFTDIGGSGAPVYAWNENSDNCLMLSAAASDAWWRTVQEQTGFWAWDHISRTHTPPRPAYMRSDDEYIEPRKRTS